MKNVLIIIFLLLTVSGYSQGHFGSKSFLKPTLSNVSLYIQSETQVNIDAFILENGGAVVNTYRILLDTNNPPIDTILYSPLNYIMLPATPYELSEAATGLTPGQTYYIKACASNIVGETCTNVVSVTMPSTPNSSPIVATNDATNVGTTTVRLNGNVTSDGGATVTDRGFYYSMTYPPSTQVSSGSGTGTFYSDLSGLNAGQTYYFRAYAVNSVDESLGDIYSVTLNTPSGNPSVTTTTAINITTNGAVSGGNVLHDGGSPILSRGVCYSTSASVDTTDFKVIAGGTIGEFGLYLPNLTHNTTYYYRAFARNANGITYGTEYNFTTPNISGLATVITTPATDITTGQAVVGGNVTADGGSTVVGRGVCYGTSPNPTTGSSSEAGIGSFSVQISYLTTGTRYYYRAYAINSSGIAYGDNLEFITLNPLTVPVLSTVAAIEITDSTAVAGGNITYDGSSQILRSGVCYSSTTSNPTTANSLSLSSAITGNYYVMLPNLAPNTTYYFRAYAINSVGTGYGSVMSFTTTVTSTTLPTVVVNSMTSIGVTTATGGGAVVSDGGATVTDRGLVWNTTGNPSLLNYTGITANGTGIGSFVSSLTGLTQCVTYYVRAYAINSVGTAYSNTDIVFTTNTLSLVELQLLYYVFNKKTTAPAELPADYRIYTYNDANYVCSILTYYNGTHAELCRYEEPLALGSQLYGYSNPCSKSYKTGYYLYRRTGYPILIIKTTNGIVTGINECTP